MQLVARILQVMEGCISIYTLATWWVARALNSAMCKELVTLRTCKIFEALNGSLHPRPNGSIRRFVSDIYIPPRERAVEVVMEFERRVRPTATAVGRALD